MIRWKQSQEEGARRNSNRGWQKWRKTKLRGSGWYHWKGIWWGRGGVVGVETQQLSKNQNDKQHNWISIWINGHTRVDDINKPAAITLRLFCFFLNCDVKTKQTNRRAPKQDACEVSQAIKAKQVTKEEMFRSLPKEQPRPCHTSHSGNVTTLVKQRVHDSSIVSNGLTTQDPLNLGKELKPILEATIRCIQWLTMTRAGESVPMKKRDHFITLNDLAPCTSKRQSNRLKIHENFCKLRKNGAGNGFDLIHRHRHIMVNSGERIFRGLFQPPRRSTSTVDDGNREMKAWPAPQMVVLEDIALHARTIGSEEIDHGITRWSMQYVTASACLHITPKTMAFSYLHITFQKCTIYVYLGRIFKVFPLALIRQTTFKLVVCWSKLDLLQGERKRREDPFKVRFM